MCFACESLLLTVLNIKTISLVPEVQKKVPEKKIPEKKVPVPKKEAVPPAKGIFGKIFAYHVLLSCFYFIF